MKERGGRARRSRRVLVATLVLAAASAGCGVESGGTGEAGSLAGPDVTLAWSTSSVFRVGGVEAPDWAAFGEITDLAFDGSGRLHVLDGQRRQVTILDADGGLERTVGRPGEGPGEFRFPSALTVAGDGRLAVYDPGHGGFVVFDARGGFLHDVSVDTEGFPAPEPPLGVTTTGRVVSPNTVVAAELEPGRPVMAWSLDPDEPHRVIREAWRPPTPTTEEPGADLTGGLRIRLPPVVAFHPGLLVVPRTGGGVAVVDSTAWRVELVDEAGTVVRVLERPMEPRTVTDEIREAERARRLEEAMADPPRLMVSSSEGGAAAGADDLARRFVEARITGMGFHDVVPVVAQVGRDRRGRLWVHRTGNRPGAGGPTDVVTDEGAYLGTLSPDAVAFPDAFGPGDLLAYRGVDEFGAPVVEVRRLVERPGR